MDSMPPVIARGGKLSRTIGADPYASDDIDRLYRKVDEEERRYTTMTLHAPGETSRGSTAQPFIRAVPGVTTHVIDTAAARARFTLEPLM
jgi:adenine-specific DNA-methyltransferase